jgi:hypothetical protein
LSFELSYSPFTIIQMREYILIIAFVALFSSVFAQGSQFEIGQPKRICSCEAMFDMRHHSNHHSYRPFIMVPCQHEFKAVEAVRNQPNWFDSFKRKRQTRRARRNVTRNAGGIIRPF